MTMQEKSRYWYYMLEGATYAYDVRFYSEKSKQFVISYLMDHWNCTSDEILNVWPGN